MTYLLSLQLFASLSILPSLFPSACPSLFPSVYQSLCISINPSICLSILLSVNSFACYPCLSFHMSYRVCVCVFQSVQLSVYMSLFHPGPFIIQPFFHKCSSVNDKHFWSLSCMLMRTGRHLSTHLKVIETTHSGLLRHNDAQRHSKNLHSAQRRQA